MRWRDHIELHPAAEIFPMMSDEEIDAIAEDIKERGLIIDITVWREYSGNMLLFDGRNRLDALQRIEFLRWSKSKQRFEVRTPPSWDFRDLRLNFADTKQDPYKLALAMNARRRHLSNDQKRLVVSNLLKVFPGHSDLAIAKMAGVSHPTVASVRAELESVGAVEKFSTRTDTLGRQQQAHKPYPPARFIPGGRVDAPYERAEREARAAKAAAVNDCTASSEKPSKGNGAQSAAVNNFTAPPPEPDDDYEPPSAEEEAQAQRLREVWDSTCERARDLFLWSLDDDGQIEVDRKSLLVSSVSIEVD